MEREIAALPLGYEVNDVQFVTLQHSNGDFKTFCCFCGTQTCYSTVYSVCREGEQLLPFLDSTATKGFVGFFRMDEVLNYDNSHANNPTVKLRNIERTEQLTKFVAYPEYMGHYYISDTSNHYIDNAVLDIVGIANTDYNNRGCVTRVKFYPEIGDSVLWDNNIRISYDYYEKPIDIISADNKIVILSRNTANNGILYLRCNAKETTHYGGGLEFTSTRRMLSIDNITVPSMHSSDSATSSCFGDARLCPLNDTLFAVVLVMDNHDASIVWYRGVFSLRFRIDVNQIINFKDGLYDKIGYCELKDVTYLSGQDMIAYLYGNESKLFSEGVIQFYPWTSNQSNNFHLGPNVSYSGWGMESIATSKSGTDDRILIGGHNISGSHYWMLSLPQYSFLATQSHCFWPGERSAFEASAVLRSNDIGFPIVRRFPDNSRIYPTTTVRIRSNSPTAVDLCEPKAK